MIGQAFAATLLNPPADHEPEPTTRLRAELIRLVRTMNRAWTIEGDVTKLRSCFHPSIATPTGRPRRDETRIGARLELAQAAHIVAWKESDIRIRLYGSGHFAVVSYAYELELELHGQRIKRTGRDLLALVQEGQRWWIVADECGSGEVSLPAPAPLHTASPGLPARDLRAGGLRWAECDYHLESGLQA